MEQKVLEKIQRWDSFEKLESSLRKELDEIKKDEKALYDAFYTDIAFGTGGLRGILGVGTNRMNIYVVAKTTKGFVDYMVEKYPNVKRIYVRAVYVERNCEMIQNSRYCIVYYDENNAPKTRKSGTKIALDFATKLNKKIIVLL